MSTRDCFLLGSWLSSKKTVEAAAYIGVDLIEMVKTNTKGFFKATIERFMKDFPGGFYIVLSSKPMVPGERPLLTIGYNYNSQYVLSFVDAFGGGELR